MSNVAYGYIFFPKLTLLNIWDEPKKHLAFSGLDAESVLRGSTAASSFSEEKGAIPRSGISFKTLSILIQLMDLFPLTVRCSLQHTEKGFYS